MVGAMRSNFARLLKLLKRSFPEADLEVVRRAYRRANEAHEGQMRLSGEPYVMHSIKVAQILAQLGLDPVTCAAALLHDVLEDTPVTLDELREQFGQEIAVMVDGVTKIGGLGFSEENAPLEEKQAQNIRKMLVATARDVRVILIKLADRLHNMRTIEFLPQDKQARISRETLDIYGPLAHRLGVSSWRWELEDHAFHVLQPEAYREISSQVSMKRRERESYLNETIRFLEARLSEAGGHAAVIGRPKHLYSIYHKMTQQGKDFAEVMDVLGVRIITRTESGCYKALGVVHGLWPPVPGRLKDYVAMPKLNRYQAIHTTVMRENGLPMEVQIRSEEMDRTAREGIASHWVYKEGEGGADRRLDDQLTWLRQMYEWLKDAAASPEELMDSMRRDFRESHVYVFTPKGEVKELPSGATPLDFAYLVHSEVGHQCIGARANSHMVPLTYHLQTGDMIEILTSRNQVPRLDWLDNVVTGRARTRIRQRLREQGDLPALDTAGAKPRTEPARLVPRVRKVRDVDQATRQKLIRIEGAKGMVVQFGKCCNPMPGTPVVAYVTKEHSITVHRMDCKSFVKSARDPNRIVEAFWEGESVLDVAVRVLVGPRPNAIADITSALRPLNLDIHKATYGPGEEGKSHFDFFCQVTDEKTVDLAVRALLNVSGVSQVTRLNQQERAPVSLEAVAGA